MDPNETLEQIRRLVRNYNDSVNSGAADLIAGDALDLFITLDEWLSKGGFLPQDWSK